MTGVTLWQRHPKAKAWLAGATGIKLEVQGLAIALMAGEIASLLSSRMAVPVLYSMAYHRTAATSPAQ